MTKSKNKSEAVQKVEITCHDCTTILADGGKSEFKFPKAGLINESTLCPRCEGHGVIKD